VPVLGALRRFREHRRHLPSSNGSSPTARTEEPRAAEGVRTLLVLSHNLYVRNLMSTGALDGLDESATYWVASTRVTARDELMSKPRFEGFVDVPPTRARRWSELRQFLLFALRFRSTTMRRKLEAREYQLRRWSRRFRVGGGPVEASVRFQLRLDWRRILYALAHVPGLKQLGVAVLLRRVGINRELHEIVRRVDPDLVIAPYVGTDDLAHDAIRSARLLGVPSFVLVVNWDNLSSKGAFAVKPDRLGVWGEQSAEHAARIHGIPRRRVELLGVPTFDHYFRYPSGSEPAPFPFRYVVFAGCFAAFDELTPLRRLDDLIETRGLDLKVVYRPHPYRQDRLEDDFVAEETFRHVIVDPQLRDWYVGAYRSRTRKIWQDPDAQQLPNLDYYAPLLDGASFVICPFSTMIIEAAIFERHVLVPAWDDGIHPIPPSSVIDYEHFQGIEEISGLEVCSTQDAFEEGFLRLSADAVHGGSPESMSAQIEYFLHHDEHPYRDRLAAAVGRIAAPRSGGRERGS
jgi:LmbE family N-acetylglucosaminyl deacetylase